MCAVNQKSCFQRDMVQPEEDQLYQAVLCSHGVRVCQRRCCINTSSPIVRASLSTRVHSSDTLFMFIRLGIAFGCCGLGACGMLLLWWRWAHKYVWVLNDLPGVILTFASIYGAQNDASDIATLAVTGSCTDIATFLLFGCALLDLARSLVRSWALLPTGELAVLWTVSSADAYTRWRRLSSACARLSSVFRIPTTQTTTS